MTDPTNCRHFTAATLCAVAAILLWAALLCATISRAVSGADAPAPVQPLPEPEVITLVRYATEEEQAARDRETEEILAQLLWGEARGCSATEQAAVIWCVLNRVDSPDFPNDIRTVATQHLQFVGYSPDNPVEESLLALVRDVLGRWELERCAVGDVGRVLPREYVFFDGDGTHNHFRTTYTRTGETWDWSLESPYEQS